MFRVCRELRLVLTRLLSLLPGGHVIQYPLFAVERVGRRPRKNALFTGKHDIFVRFCVEHGLELFLKWRRRQRTEV